MARRLSGTGVVPTGSAEEVEQQFYEALREADLERMMALWGDDDEVVCVHPGGPRIVGPAAVRAIFEQIFGNGPVRVKAERVRRVASAQAAMHSVVERIELQTDEGPRIGHVMATNVYLRTPRGWRIVAHHASPGGTDEPAEVVEAPSVLH